MSVKSGEFYIRHEANANEQTGEGREHKGLKLSTPAVFYTLILALFLVLLAVMARVRRRRL